MSDRNRKEFLRTTGMNGQAYAKVSAFFLPLLGARAHWQTRKAPKTFHHLLSLRNAHFIEGRHECPPCCPGCTVDLGSLRVVSQQAAIHELIDRTASRIRNSFDPADELAQKDYLRLPCNFLLLSSENDYLDCLEVDSQERVVDRGGQVTLISPLRAKQFVQTDKQANVEDIETGLSTYCHRAHQHPLGVPAVSALQRFHSLRYIHYHVPCFNYRPSQAVPLFFAAFPQAYTARRTVRLN